MWPTRKSFPAATILTNFSTSGEADRSAATFNPGLGTQPLLCQKTTLSENSMTLGSRAALKDPKFEFVCCPAGLNVATVYKLENCVWFQVLYDSARNWTKRPSERSGTRLLMARSQLLTPGPYKRPIPALPKPPDGVL